MDLNPIPTNTNIPNFSNKQNNTPPKQVKFSGENDSVELSTKQPETSTPWYKKTTTLILAGLAAAGAGYLLLRGKGNKAEEIVNKTVKTVETKADEITPEIQHKLKNIEADIKDEKNKLGIFQKKFQEITQTRNEINKFVSEKVVNNPELEDHWKFLEKIENSYDNNDPNAGKLYNLKFVVQDLMLSKANPEKAKIIETNFKNNFGFSTEQITEMFEKLKDKSSDEILKIFEPLKTKIKERAEQIKDESKNLFIIKETLNHAAENRANVIDSTKFIGSQTAKEHYSYYAFLPKKLHIAIENTNIYFEELERKIQNTSDNIKKLEAEKSKIK